MNLQPKYTETELVQKLKRHERAAFEYLYDNYSGAIYTMLLSIISDRESAGDLLQEVFVKIWQQIKTYDDKKGRLYTWMINIARNAAIDVTRSRSYQNTKQNQPLTTNVYEAEVSDAGLDNIGLRKIVHTLKDEYKVLIELAYFQGFTQEEMAESLQIPLGTVKTRLRAALIQLRKILNPGS